MSKILCHKVKLRSLEDVTAKAYFAIDHNGNQCWLPKSQVIRPDGEDAWWITEWILKQKNLIYSDKDPRWIDIRTMIIQPKTIIKKYTPPELKPREIEPDASLIR